MPILSQEMAPPTNSSGTTVTPDPDNQFQTYLQEWEQDQAQYAQDMKNLQAAIATMMAMLHSGNVQGALMYAQMNVMQGAMTVQGDNINVIAGSENLATGVRNFITDTQNIFNEGGNIVNNSTDASNFAKWMNQFYTEISNSNSNGNWLDPNDQQNMLSSLQTVFKNFGANPGQLNTTEVTTCMKNWFPAQNTSQPNPSIAAVQNSFQVLNNSCSALSTTATTLEQFWTNIFNQLEGLTNNMYQSTAQSNSAFVQNEKTG